MSEELLCKKSTQYLKAHYSYQRKTQSAKFGFPHCMRELTIPSDNAPPYI